MARDITQTTTFDATPAVIYRALVDAKHHAAFTQSRAQNDGKVGGTFAAYDGYIVGFNVELAKGKRIVQAWRANDWKEGAWSVVRFELEPAGTGRTRLTLTQHGVPEENHKSINQGWKDFYWTPLGAWLAARAKQGPSPRKSQAKAGTKKTR